MKPLINADVLKELADLGIREKNANERIDLEKNANETMNTGQAGYGAELVQEGFAKEIIDLTRENSSFLSALPGDHGENLPKAYTAPVIGEAPFFNGATEWSGGNLEVGTADSKIATDDVTLNQKKFKIKIALSDDLLLFNTQKGKLTEIIKQKISKSMIRTVDSIIINGDDEAGANTNINSIDGTPTALSYYLEIDDSWRKIALNDADMRVSIGTLDFADFITMQSMMGDLTQASDALWIFNNQTYIKSKGITEFLTESVNGKGSTVHDGAITNILGSDVFVARDLTKANATGNISDTASNNSKGVILYVNKNMVQYGFGAGLDIAVVWVPGDGYMLIGWYWFAFTILNKLVGETDPSHVLGYNVTL